MKIDHILFPTDFSDASEFALEYTMFLAERFEADISVIHVIEPPDTRHHPEFAFQYMQNLRDIAQEQINTLVKGWDFEFRSLAVLEGKPHLEIIRCVEDWEVDLIVMASGRRSALGDLVLGSTTVKIMRHTSCPVLSIPVIVESS
jgi:universal stress protein A